MATVDGNQAGAVVDVNATPVRPRKNGAAG
jgi:hypothetical protein